MGTGIGTIISLLAAIDVERRISIRDGRAHGEFGLALDTCAQDVQGLWDGINY
jgi:hypothetical protein